MLWHSVFFTRLATAFRIGVGINTVSEYSCTISKCTMKWETFLLPLQAGMQEARIATLSGTLQVSLFLKDNNFE